MVNVRENETAEREGGPWKKEGGGGVQLSALIWGQSWKRGIMVTGGQSLGKGDRRPLEREEKIRESPTLKNTLPVVPFTRENHKRLTKLTKNQDEKKGVGDGNRTLGATEGGSGRFLIKESEAGTGRRTMGKG